jgi:tRNA (guanine37-N1)-methyltransferase
MLIISFRDSHKNDIMHYLKIEPKKANAARSMLMDAGLFDTSRHVQHSRSYVYFPIKVKDAKAKKLSAKLHADIVSKKEPDKGAKDDFRARLSDILTTEEQQLLSRGYDQLGDIAIIEFDGSKAKGRKIGKLLIETNSSIKTVLAKAGAVQGKYRIRKVEYLAGKRNFIATYRENNCTFRFDVRKVFFSNRLSYERSRILGLVKDGENVMVMFAGVGPFAIEIAKANPKTSVVAIEMNRFGYKYMRESITLNKLSNVKPVLGDVKKMSGKYKNFADRIIMPLPRSSMEFLDDVHKVAKKNAIVHFYVFSETGSIDKIKEKIIDHAKKLHHKIKFLDERVVRPYSTFESEFVIDFRITKN